MGRDSETRGDRASHDRNSAEEEGQVITLSWQVVLLPVVAAAVVAVGFFFGRLWQGGGEPDPQAQAGAQAQTGAQAQAGAGLAGSPAGGNVIQLPTSQPGGSVAGSRYPEDQVVNLPVPSHPLMNQAAPDFTMKLLATGEDVSLSDYAGQEVMINFWSTWCPPCRFEMPWIQDTAQAYEDQGFVVLAVDAGERVPPSMVEDTISQFVTSMALSVPVLWGDNTLQVQREWTVQGLPSTFFVDQHGTVVDMHQGMFPNKVTLEDRVNRLLEIE